MWNALKTIKLWQVGVLVVVMVGAAAAVYGGFALAGSSSGNGLTKDQQLVPAQVGNLVNQVSVSGSLTYPITEVLTFGTDGTIDKLLVAEGDTVKQGQTLAQLDATSIASLQKAVAQAQVNLKAAQDDLEAAKNPYTALEIAQAQASVASQRLAVQSAQQALDTARAPYSASDIAQAEANVASKRVALQTAQQNLDNLLHPTEQSIAQARSAVSSALVSVQNAQQALDTLKAASPTEELDKAQAAVDNAQSNLDAAKEDQASSKATWDEKVAAAQDAYDTALSNYKSVFNKYLGVTLTDSQASQDPDTLLASLDIDLSTLYSRDVGPLAYPPGALVSIPPDDPSTPWNETVVFAWIYLKPGTIVGTCEGVTLPSNAVCAKSDMDAVWTPLKTATDNLASTLSQASRAALTSQKAVEQAQSALDSAQKILDLLKAGTDPVVVHQANVQAKQDQLTVSQASLKAAQDNLERLLNPDPLTIDSLTRQVAVAKAQLADAEQNFSDMKATPDPLTVESKARQLDTAKAQLADAEQRLANMLAGADPDTVALKETNVSTARLALQAAQQRLDSATLKAPFDGTVSTVSVSRGQSVGANTAILTLVDTSVVSVSGSVDEIDILYVKEGATATVTLDALQGQTLQGVVTSISSAARTTSGVVSYPVEIQVTVPQGISLRAGLTATANIVLRQENNVLLIPSLALRGSYIAPYVLLADGGKTRQQSVSVGDSDGYWVVVTQGLSAGDQVVMDVTSSSAQGNINAAIRQFQFGTGAITGGAFTGPTGGGFTGGGQQRQQTGR